MNPPTYLANKNKHERDDHITFDEGPHIYTIDGDSDFMSVTTWNHSHFSHFDADEIITKMERKDYFNNPNHKYYKKTREEIKELWKQNGIKASEAGTKMHYDIECYYNNCPNENDSIEYKYFLEFKETVKHLTPYRTEWMIWDKELKFAGSIDMIFENKDGSLEIYDWKRSKGIVKTNAFQNAKTECISHLPDSNYWHYCLQLNTYKALLEKNYGKKVNGMYLVCLHPNNLNEWEKKQYDKKLIPGFKKFKVVDLQNEINDLFELRKITLNTTTKV